MVNRLKLLRKELRLTQALLGRTLGITKSAVSMIENGNAALSERNMDTLFLRYGASGEWLRTGRGPMFDPLARADTSFKDPVGEVSHSVPLYDLHAAGGLRTLLADEGSIQPVGWIRIPGMPRCDGAVRVEGEGLAPVLSGGDTVLYSRVEPSEENIFWGKIYLLSIDVGGEEYVVVRYLRRGGAPGRVTLSGSDPRDDKEVEMERIRALAAVMASIRQMSAL